MIDFSEVTPLHVVSAPQKDYFDCKGKWRLEIKRKDIKEEDIYQPSPEYVLYLYCLCRVQVNNLIFQLCLVRV